MALKTLYRRLTGRNRLIVVVFSGIVVLVIYFIVYNHVAIINASKREVLDKLQAIANTASLQINAYDHQKLSTSFKNKDDIVNNSDDPIYERIHSQLAKIAQVNHLETPLYTMVYNQDKEVFEFICTSSENPYYRHPFMNFPERLRENYTKGGTIDTYEDEYGTWLSAFAPIKNKSGQVVAVIQTDQSLMAFTDQANMALYKNIFLALLVIVPFSVFMYSFMNNTLKREEEDKLRLEEKNEEIQLQNELIRSSHQKLEKAKILIEEKNKSLDKQVNLRTRELLRANIDLTTFLYRSSHDVQGPIATIKGLCNMANIDPNRLDEYVGMISSSAHLLSNRVKSISAVYEIKNKKVKRVVFDLFDLIEDIAKKNIKRFDQVTIDFRLEIPKLFKVFSDKAIIRIILDELIKNAIQNRNPEGPTSITISAGMVGAKAFKVTVEDNGMGIDPDKKHLVFKMFKRGNESSSGTGLGLYSIRLALKKLHGKIELISKPTEGARFEVIIPN